ncbi:MAG: transposase, partial [Bacteroidales bacterium]|nr:transposase [Bacteroidales bacterium]
MFLYQTRKRELYYDRVVELYLQTGFGKKRLSRLIPEVDPSTIRRWIANFVVENPQVASMKRAK